MQLTPHVDLDFFCALANELAAIVFTPSTDLASPTFSYTLKVALEMGSAS